MWSSRVRHGSARWLLVVLGLALAAGVGALSARLAAPSASAADTPAPGASVLAVPAVNQADAPCALLTSAQRRQLGVNPGTPNSSGGEVTCVWRSIARQPWGGEYLAKVLHGPTPAGAPAPAINNRPTVEYQPAGLDQNAYCVYLVTVAPDRTLWVQYGGPGQEGINHVVACRRAQAAASSMSSTFGTLPK